MIPMRVVQVVVHQVVGVIAVRHRLVAAARPMPVARLVPRASVVRRAPVWVRLAHRDRVLVDVILVGVMQVAIVQEIDVAVVLDRGVAASLAVDVVVALVGIVRHRSPFGSSFEDSRPYAVESALAKQRMLRLTLASALAPHTRGAGQRKLRLRLIISNANPTTPQPQGSASSDRRGGTAASSPPAREWIELAERRLRGAGHRSSAPRAAVIELIGRQQCVLTAPEIAEQLRRRGKPVATATIYRALEGLEALGLLRLLDSREGPAYFEPALPGGAHHHHHLVCERCGRVIAFEDEALERAVDSLAKRLDHHVTGHDVVLTGRCRECGADGGAS